MESLMLDKDEMEWQELQREFCETWTKGSRVRTVECAPRFSNKPHPDSYGAHLPMWSDGASLSSLTRTNKAERVQLAKRPVMVKQSRDVMPEALQRAGHFSTRRSPHATYADIREAQDIDKARTAILRRREGVRARATELALNFATVEV